MESTLNEDMVVAVERAINPEKHLGLQMGFEAMASVHALALLCSNELSYEDPYIGSRPICSVHLNP